MLMFCPSQPAVTENGSLIDSGLDLVSESINMATVPLLMARDTPGGEEEEECKEEQEDSNPVSLLSNGLAFYEDTEEPQIIISPTSEEQQTTQSREDKLILDLKSLNCSSELLESVEKFLS